MAPVSHVPSRGGSGQASGAVGPVNGADSYLAKPLKRVEVMVHAVVLSGGDMRYAGCYGYNDEEQQADSDLPA